jgi:hypothetical protein
MGVLFGPSNWWQANLVSACPEGTFLPDGSSIICKSGGTAWIVAPACTQVSSQWAGGQYNSTQVGDKCCISEWSGLQTALINYGFNPDDWFVPSASQLQNPGYVCRTNWDSFSSTSPYWSSTENSAPCAFCVSFCFNGCTGGLGFKTFTNCVRAFRCVTY